MTKLFVRTANIVVLVALVVYIFELDVYIQRTYASMQKKKAECLRAYQMGQRAYTAGESAVENPFTYTSELHHYWSDGWDENANRDALNGGPGEKRWLDKVFNRGEYATD